MESKYSIYTDVMKVGRGVWGVAGIALIISIIAGVVIYAVDPSSENIKINNAVGAANIIPSLAGILIAAIALVAYVKVEDPRSKQTDEIVRARNRVIAQFDMVLASWMKVKGKARISNDPDVDFASIYNSVRVTQKVLDEALYGTTLMSMLIRVEKLNQEGVRNSGQASAPEIMATFSNACEELLNYEKKASQNDDDEFVYPKRSLDLWSLLTCMNDAVRLLKALGNDSDIYRHIKRMGTQELAFEDELSLMVGSRANEWGVAYGGFEKNMLTVYRDELEATLRKRSIDAIVRGTEAENDDNGGKYDYMTKLDRENLDNARRFLDPKGNYNCFKLYSDVEINVVAVIKEIMESVAKSWSFEFIDLRYQSPPVGKSIKWVAFYVLDHSQQSEDLMFKRIKQMSSAVGGLLILDGFPHPYAAYSGDIVKNLKKIASERTIERTISHENKDVTINIKFPKIDVLAIRYVERFKGKPELSANEEVLEKTEPFKSFYQPDEAVVEKSMH